MNKDTFRPNLRELFNIILTMKWHKYLADKETGHAGSLRIDKEQAVPVPYILRALCSMRALRAGSFLKHSGNSSRAIRTFTGMDKIFKDFEPHSFYNDLAAVMAVCMVACMRSNVRGIYIL